MSAPKFYVTTAIPYVNGRPHMGHAMEYIQTDVTARFHRQLGEDVYFLTGTDDNSLKNVLAAEKAGQPTADFVKAHAQVFKDMCQALEITNDGFIETACEAHHRGASKLWTACDPDDIYKKTYEGLYCVGCETFYTPDELDENGCCPEHKTKPEIVREENHFFRLSKYQDQIEELIASDTYRVVPEMRKNEILSFIRGGLEDISVSRSHQRAHDWGVPVPGDPEQVMYVWIDALSNYITGIDYGDDGAGTDPENLYTKYWPCDAHMIGKGIIRFHAVYWPAFLLSAGLPLPRELFVHGYVNLGGEKMSKSLGAVVDPFELVEKYGVETVRYYMTRHIHPVHDSDFSYEALEAAYTADLANGIGNLMHRSLTMIEKHQEGKIKAVETEEAGQPAIRELFDAIFKDFEDLMKRYEFQQAMARVWEGQRALDVYINEQKPWSLAKDPACRAQLEAVNYTLAEGLRCLASLIYAVMPATSIEIFRRLGLDATPDAIAWKDQKQWGILTDGLAIDKSKPLFPRLEE